MENLDKQGTMESTEPRGVRSGKVIFLSALIIVIIVIIIIINIIIIVIIITIIVTIIIIAITCLFIS